MSVVEHAIKNCLAEFHAPNMRYKHLGFSSKDFSVLATVEESLKTLLPDYEIWDGLRPNENAPEQGCSRFDFLTNVFNYENELLIFQPDSWLLHWSLSDQQAFWAQLAIQHGSQNIVVVFNENHAFTKQNNHYFSPLEIPNTPLTLWVSSKNTLTD